MKFVPVPGTEVSFCIWETRVKDYAAYAAANAGVDGKWKNPVYFKRKFSQGETHPVVMVNWDDAQAFCAWLTRKERAAGKITASQRYRLPTDAEWSVAVGLGKETDKWGKAPRDKSIFIKGVYPWGKEWPPPKGAGNYGQSLNVDSFEYTSPVGSFSPNAFGIYDLGGNVAEWCEDWQDPVEKKWGRVLRGNYYRQTKDLLLLSSYRGHNMNNHRFWYNGFRCVLVGGSGG
jgi:formylglycine-generating enzyme required for sulfatase activity